VSHEPQRTCIACRQVRSKMDLVRLTRDGDGARVDWRGVAAGRGAYACPTIECLDRAFGPGRLGRSLKGAVNPPRETAAEIVEYWRRR
jgi:hypothetical protein